jgi:hypothetical protein
MMKRLRFINLERAVPALRPPVQSSSSCNPFWRHKTVPAILVRKSVWLPCACFERLKFFFRRGCCGCITDVLLCQIQHQPRRSRKTDRVLVQLKASTFANTKATPSRCIREYQGNTVHRLFYPAPFPCTATISTKVVHEKKKFHSFCFLCVFFIAFLCAFFLLFFSFSVCLQMIF